MSFAGGVMTIDYSWIKNRISKENIGSHDADNRFLLEDVERQISKYLHERPDITLLGVCYDDAVENYDCYPLVYEDKNGNRFYTHWDVNAFLEYAKKKKE